MRIKAGKTAILSHNKLFPVRFEPEDEWLVRQLSKQSGLSLLEVIRRSVRYAAPRFLGEQADIHAPREERDLPAKHMVSGGTDC